MATSLHSGLVRAYVPQVASGPIEAHIARDCVVSNALHLADECGQVVIDWAGTVGGALAYLTTEAAIVADVWQEIETYEGIVCPVHADTGIPYALRVRVGGYSSGGHDVDFRLAIAAGTPSSATADDSAYLTGSTPSGSAAWLGGFSLGANGWGHLVQMTAAQVGPALPFLTLTEIGGSALTGEQHRINLTVWGRTANVASTPRLSGLYAAWYVGDGT